MRIEPEIDGVTVVLVGNFNPAIFTPAWFALHSLLPESIADSAELEVAHPQVTVFKADWLSLEVTPERFLFETVQAPHVRVHDLVLRVFNEHVYHTPLRAFGINRDVHFPVRSPNVRNQLGRSLAPVEPWGACGLELGLDGEHGGMTSLTMSQVSPEGRHAGGRINVKVEPSVRMGNGRTGVYVGVNDHYAIDGAGLDAAGRLMDVFKDNFGASLSRSERIVDHVMSLVED